MAWKELSVSDARRGLIEMVERQRVSVREASLFYGVTRKTGHKWLRRYREMEPGGLENRSRARLTQEQTTSEAIQELIRGHRAAHPRWGAEKIRVLLGRDLGADELPSVSTVHRVMRAAGQVKRRQTRVKTAGPNGSVPAADAPNVLWNADHKGAFRMGNGYLCYPLTVTDAHSRYVLCCAAGVGTTIAEAQEQLEAVFREYGVPRALRTDNGVPFAGSGAGRLTRLGVWLMRQEVELVQITKGCPQENGAHERMHRDLKAETTKPPAFSLSRQQARFDVWREEYNEVRPHAALELATPSSWYERSEREYRESPPEPEYAGWNEVRRVDGRGRLKLGRREYAISVALAGQLVEMEEVDDGEWVVRFYRTLVAEIDERRGRLIRLGGLTGGGTTAKRYGRPGPPRWS